MMRDSLTEGICPRCGMDATIQFNVNDRLCYVCGLRWESGRQLQDEPAEAHYTNVFTSAEIERLRIYRAAVRAGFYHG
jgi:ribosomal protein L37E